MSWFEENNEYEAESQPDVANVTEDMIESHKYPPGPGTAVVEETLLVVLAFIEDQLAGRDQVEERDQQHLVDVGLRPASSVPLVSLVPLG